MAHIRVFPSLFPSSGLESGDVSNVSICSGPGPGRWVRGRGLGGCLQKILACPDACSLCCLALSRACLRYCRCCSAHVSQRVWSGMGERRIRHRARGTWPSAVSLGRFGGSVLCAPASGSYSSRIRAGSALWLPGLWCRLDPWLRRPRLGRGLRRGLLPVGLLFGLGFSSGCPAGGPGLLGLFPVVGFLEGEAVDENVSFRRVDPDDTNTCFGQGADLYPQVPQLADAPDGVGPTATDAVDGHHNQGVAAS